jgi:lysophospholipase L1-like esterase
MRPVPRPTIPTLFIAGDSTAAVNTATQQGWGVHFQDYFEPTKLRVVNAARSGLSSRTFITSGAWQALLDQVRPDDYVIIQFGHNDNGPIDAFRFRGTIAGLGEETQEAHDAQGRPETVHTFGWYLRTMIRDVQEKRANPIVMSMTVRAEWADGKIERGLGDYARLAGELARAEGVRFIDLTNLVADQYQELDPEAVRALFTTDTTHTNRAGAERNARAVIAGLRALREYALINALSAAGRAVETGPAQYALPPRLAVPRGEPPEIFDRWLNLPEVPDPALPSIFLIGDSTVRNGRGDGVDGQWGWGDPLAAYFDPARVNLVNRAVGGTTAGSFYNTWWAGVRDLLKPGDIVLMQFGTNAEDQASFTDHLRRYIADCRARQVTPIVCTLVPRNTWANGRIARTDPRAQWARDVANQERVALLDLQNLIAARYDTLGREATTALFESGPHTNRRGAEFSAKIVAESLAARADVPFVRYLREKPAANW